MLFLIELFLMMFLDRDATSVELFHIEGPIVQKVIEYMNYHQKVIRKR